MKALIMAVFLILAGIASADTACLKTCCERHGGTMDEHGCSLKQGDANFQDYLTCSGYCISGTAPPDTVSDGAQPTTGPAVSPDEEKAEPMFEGGPSETQACGIGALLLALVAILGFFVMNR